MMCRVIRAVWLLAITNAAGVMTPLMAPSPLLSAIVGVVVGFVFATGVCPWHPDPFLQKRTFSLDLSERPSSVLNSPQSWHGMFRTSSPGLAALGPLVGRGGGGSGAAADVAGLVVFA